MEGTFCGDLSLRMTTIRKPSLHGVLMARRRIRASSVSHADAFLSGNQRVDRLDQSIKQHA